MTRNMMSLILLVILGVLTAAILSTQAKDDDRTITVVDEQPQGMDMDPTCSLFTTGQCLGEPDLLASARRLQFFSHQYSIAVLMANARGNSALWDEYGRLIVRADRGSLLLVGQRSSQGWQGDIIPLR